MYALPRAFLIPSLEGFFPIPKQTDHKDVWSAFGGLNSHSS
jgi:hypothetical protein